MSWSWSGMLRRWRRWLACHHGRQRGRVMGSFGWVVAIIHTTLLRGRRAPSRRRRHSVGWRCPPTVRLVQTKTLLVVGRLLNAGVIFPIPHALWSTWSTILQLASS